MFAKTYYYSSGSQSYSLKVHQGQTLPPCYVACLPYLGHLPAACHVLTGSTYELSHCHRDGSRKPWHIVPDWKEPHTLRLHILSLSLLDYGKNLHMSSTAKPCHCVWLTGLGHVLELTLVNKLISINTTTPAAGICTICPEFLTFHCSQYR